MASVEWKWIGEESAGGKNVGEEKKRQNKKGMIDVLKLGSFVKI